MDFLDEEGIVFLEIKHNCKSLNWKKQKNSKKNFKALN